MFCIAVRIMGEVENKVVTKRSTGALQRAYSWGRWNLTRLTVQSKGGRRDGGYNLYILRQGNHHKIGTRRKNKWRGFVSRREEHQNPLRVFPQKLFARKARKFQFQKLVPLLSPALSNSPLSSNNIRTMYRYS